MMPKKTPVLDQAARTYRVGGTPREAGRALGRRLGSRLARNIARYIETGPAHHRSIDVVRLRTGALPWLRRLPQRYQEEMAGMAEGASISLQRLAEWCYVEVVEDSVDGCSAVLLRHRAPCSRQSRDRGTRRQDEVWVARNNDLWAPDMWGYLTIHEIEGRLARMDFGLEGELFTSSGINETGLWLHYNWLPTFESPPAHTSALPPFVWLSEALETCRSLADVEAMLYNVPCDGAMMLFAVEGPSASGAVYECACSTYRRRPLADGWLAGTNHYVTDLPVADGVTSSSQSRLRHLRRLMRTLSQRIDVMLPDDLIRVLADPNVEQRGDSAGTVYAVVASPGTRRIWYTYGGYPAASAGSWVAVPWPWS